MAEYVRSMTAEELTEELDISKATLNNYIKEGLPHDNFGRGRPSQFSIEEVRAWQAENGKTGQAGRPPKNPERSGDREEEELRKTAAMADNWEIRNAVALGELLPANEVEKSWSKLLSTLRSKLMNIPASCAPRCAEQDAATIAAEIERSIREALTDVERAYDSASGEAAEDA